MSDTKISALLGFSLLASPLASQPISSTLSAKTAIPSPSSPRAALRKMRAQLASTPVLEPMGTFVGQLQEKWQFPSDHLPIGMTYHNLHIASWNVLDSNYIDWVIEKNSQGLSRSQIAEQHVFIGKTGLTFRDLNVIHLLLEMIEHPTHPKHLLSLQECNEPFLAALRQALPPHFTLVAHKGNAVVFDQTRLTLLDEKAVPGLFADQPERTIQTVLLSDVISGEKIRLVNAHLPGDPLQPSRYEFGRYLADTLDPQVTTMAMGDMNFNEWEMTEAVNSAFDQGKNPFSLYTPYCTNISPFTFRSKAIDHFIVFCAEGQKAVQVLEAEEVMAGLQPTLNLLMPAKE